MLASIDQISNENKNVAECSPSKHALEEAKQDFRKVVSREYPSWMKQKEEVQQKQLESIDKAHEDIMKQAQDYQQMKQRERELQEALKNKRWQLERLRQQVMAEESSDSLQYEIQRIKQALKDTQDAIARKEYFSEQAGALSALDSSLHATADAVSYMGQDRESHWSFKREPKQNFPSSQTSEPYITTPTISVSNGPSTTACRGLNQQEDEASSQGKSPQPMSTSAGCPRTPIKQGSDGQDAYKGSNWGRVSGPMGTLSSPQTTTNEFSCGQTRAQQSITHEWSTNAHHVDSRNLQISARRPPVPAPTPTSDDNEVKRGNFANLESGLQSSSPNIWGQATESLAFEPTTEWKPVPRGFFVPKKCQIRYDSETGTQFARIPSAWMMSVTEEDGNVAQFAVSQKMDLRSLQRRITGLYSSGAVKLYADDKLIFDENGNIGRPLSENSTIEEANLFNRALKLVQVSTNWNSDKYCQESPSALLMGKSNWGKGTNNVASDEGEPTNHQPATNDLLAMPSSSSEELQDKITKTTSNQVSAATDEADLPQECTASTLDSKASEDSPVAYSLSSIADVLEASNDSSQHTQIHTTSTPQKDETSIEKDDQQYRQKYSEKEGTDVDEFPSAPQTTQLSSNDKTSHQSQPVITSSATLVDTEKPSIDSGSDLEESFPADEDTGSSFEFGSGGIAGYPLGSFVKPSPQKSRKQTPGSKGSAVSKSKTSLSTSRHSNSGKQTKRKDDDDKQPKALPGFGGSLGLLDDESFSSDSDSSPSYSPSGPDKNKKQDHFDDDDLEF